MSEITITIEDDWLYINEDETNKVALVEEMPYIHTENFNGYLEDMDEINDNKVLLLLILLNEFTNPVAMDEEKKVEPYCSYWDTYTAVTGGRSKSVAEANLASLVAEADSLSDCTKLGGVDTSCIWGNHLCISSQSFCCRT